MSLKTTKSVLLACALGASLALSGCQAASDTANKGTDLAKQGQLAAQEAGEKGRELADNAVASGKEMADAGLAMASEAFDNTLEITEVTADGAKEKMTSGFTALEERFNHAKDKLDAPKREELQAKFTKLKTGMTELKDKTGTDMIIAMNELKKEGAVLANEMKELVGVGEPTPAESEPIPMDETAPHAEATPEATAQ